MGDGFWVGVISGVVAATILNMLVIVVNEPWETSYRVEQDRVMSRCSQFGLNVFVRDDARYTVRCSEPEVEPLKPWEK